MSHLELESLARLVDEPPTPQETAHLESCHTCAQQLEALRRQTRELAALPPLPPDDVAWARLERQLHAEGLLRRGPAVPPLLRRAAALLLLLGAGAAGAALQARFGGHSASVAQAGVTPAGATATGATATDAAARLHDAEQQYVAALADYDQTLQSAAPADPTARLAALEGIVLTTRAALNQAPGDPVINGYHMTALAQREATMRRLVSNHEPWF
jgi:hypothetical protein